VAAGCTSQLEETGYLPREPQRTVLYHVLQEHLETFLERVERDGRSLPSFVVRELRGFLRCGIRAYGFLRVRCPTCRLEYAVPFSCKGRGFCPSCGGRFMAQTAAHLVDHVLPHGVGYRQWVLTLPFDLRYRVAYDAELGRAILRAFVKTLSAWQLERAGESGIESAQWGAVTVVQRFGSALQLMPHFHTVGCDGAFSVDADGEAQVHTLSGPTSEDVERLVDEAWTQCPDARAVSKSPLCARFGGFDLHKGGVRRGRRSPWARAALSVSESAGAVTRSTRAARRGTRRAAAQDALFRWNDPPRPDLRRAPPASVCARSTTADPSRAIFMESSHQRRSIEQVSFQSRTVTCCPRPNLLVHPLSTTRPRHAVGTTRPSQRPLMHGVSATSLRRGT